MKRILTLAALTAALCAGTFGGISAHASLVSHPSVCCKSGTMCERCPACCSKSPCPTACCVHCTAR